MGGKKMNEGDVGRKKKSVALRGIEVASARLDASAYKQIQNLAKRMDLTITQVIRASLRDYLAKHDGAGR